MPTTRAYQWTLTPAAESETVDELSRRARKVLAWACDGDDRISCKGVGGEGLGMVQISFSVTARDQWATGQISQDLINTITLRLRNPAELDLVKERPPTHRSRGYGHGRSRRINAAYGAGERAFDSSRLIVDDESG